MFISGAILQYVVPVMFMDQFCETRGSVRAWLSIVDRYGIGIQKMGICSIADTELKGFEVS